MWREVKSDAAFELRQLDQLLESFGPLLARTPATDPDRIDTTALGAMLHSFYTGVENIFKRIAIESEGAIPGGESWHSELLKSMAVPAANRPAVITMGLRDRLADYLAFRHVFRSAYSFLLRWDRMAPLVLHCEATLRLLETELDAFLAARTD